MKTAHQPRLTPALSTTGPNVPSLTIQGPRQIQLKNKSPKKYAIFSLIFSQPVPIKTFKSSFTARYSTPPSSSRCCSVRPRNKEFRPTVGWNVKYGNVIDDLREAREAGLPSRLRRLKVLLRIRSKVAARANPAEAALRNRGWKESPLRGISSSIVIVLRPGSSSVSSIADSLRITTLDHVQWGQSTISICSFETI